MIRPSGTGRGSKQTDVRAHNERLLLSLVRRNGTLSKAEIARMTGLSAQAISVIIRKLEDDGLLRRGKVQRGRVGQPSTPMALDSEGALSFGVKIGRRSVEIVLIDFVGRVRRTLRETYRWPMPDAIVTFLKRSLTTLMDELSPDDKLTVFRARKIQRFLSQPFHVAEAFTGLKGVLVPIEETIRGFNMILDGEVDEYPEAAFNLVGTIDDAIAKGKKLIEAAKN